MDSSSCTGISAMRLVYCVRMASISWYAVIRKYGASDFFEFRLCENSEIRTEIKLIPLSLGRIPTVRFYRALRPRMSGRA